MAVGPKTATRRKKRRRKTKTRIVITKLFALRANTITVIKIIIILNS